MISLAKWLNARLQTKSYVRSIYVLCLRGRVLLIKNCKSYTLKKDIYFSINLMVQQFTKVICAR